MKKRYMRMVYAANKKYYFEYSNSPSFKKTFLEKVFGRKKHYLKESIK